MGKTKDIVVHNDGTCTFTFKDDACGENGTFNPGANEVGLKIDGMGRASLLLSRHFFSILKEKGIPTHFISADVERGTMTCQNLHILPVEFIWREKAWGSFCKMYGIEQGLPLHGLIEATLKDDALGDPRINEETCVRLGKISKEQYDFCDSHTRRIGLILKEELAKYNYDLIDFKVEFGVTSTGEILLADEISGGIWRILDKSGKSVDPVESAKKICSKDY
jgi:phosphoribosylaminoimidazole-succinocarboxamide synthase